MKLLIHPLITEKDIQYANTHGIKAANSFDTALKVLDDIEVTELIMYPFFTAGKSWWSKDINHGQRLVAFINSDMFRNKKYVYRTVGDGIQKDYAKSKGLTNIRLIMDGGNYPLYG